MWPSDLFQCSYVLVLLCDLMCVCVSILLLLHSVVSCHLLKPQNLMYKGKKRKEIQTMDGPGTDMLTWGYIRKCF